MGGGRSENLDVEFVVLLTGTRRDAGGTLESCLPPAFAIRIVAR